MTIHSDIKENGYAVVKNMLSSEDIDNLIKIKCYRGSRHFLGYLVRGQRSKNKKLRRHF